MGNNNGKRKFKKRIKKNKNEETPFQEPPFPNLPPVPIIPVQWSNQEYVRALYGYTAQNQDDLSFKKGDVLSIISKHDNPWWLAEHSVTKCQGFIPSNYVVIDDGRPSSLEAWFDITRQQAIQQLMRMGNPSGTYVVRPSGDSQNCALSLRFNSQPNYWEVRHYRIKCPSDGSGYFIDQRTRFPLIADLIRYYSTQPGLCCRLTQPCPRVIKPPVQFRELEVARHSIHYVKPLGHGCFGEVFLGKWNKVLDVAVKQLKPGSVGMARSRFIEEAQVMHKLHHEKIVQILGVCTEPDNEPCLIITELMINGSLLDFLRKGEGRLFAFDQLLDVISQVADGMKYLEKLNFVHRDLRAANILVGENNEVKVADFGLSRCMEEEEIYSGNEDTKFPVKWTALEALTDKQFSTKSDVWSFGVLIYEVITYGAPPYEGMNNYEVMRFVKDNHRMSNPNGKIVGHREVHCPSELFDIMLKCWNKFPDQRYTFEILSELFEDYVVQVADTQYPEM